MAEVESPPKKKSRPSLDTEEGGGGFKFTKQSRRTKLGPKKSAVTKSARKRRSSFVRGRKERKSLAPPTDKTNLYIDIPSELPPTARLRKLFDASLELAITKLAEKSIDVKTDLPDFEEEAKAVFAHLRQLISESDIIDEACQPSAQLQREENKWDNLLQEKKNLEDKAKQELQEYIDSSGNKEECPDFLSPSQHKLLSGKPSFKSLAEARENLKQTTLLRVDKIFQVVNSLQQYGKVAEGYLNKQMESFGTKSLEVINDMGTPRALIRGHLTGH